MSGLRSDRKALLAGAAALLPMVALSAHSAAAREAPATATFAPPQSSLLLTRELRRPLADGKEVVTRRSYEITIARDGDGYRVDGTLVDVEVDAPPALHALAALERARLDVGLFPIRLDREGQIVTSNTLRTDAMVSTASERVAVRLSKAALSASDRQEAVAFVNQLRSGGGALTLWPRDLFHPVEGSRSETSRIALPGGSEGSVTITTQARARDGDGLLQSVERTVTTRLGESERITREVWMLNGSSARR